MLFTQLDADWWWLLAVFLAFDLSAIGYLAGPRIGAATYNAVNVPPRRSRWARSPSSSTTAALQLVALAWAFHIGVDRALGYGLKLADCVPGHAPGPRGRREGLSYSTASSGNAAMPATRNVAS